MMSPDDTLPPETMATEADAVKNDPDPGPSDSPSNSTDSPSNAGERCLFVKIPLLPEVPPEITDDPDQIAGLCLIMQTAVQDALREAASEHPQLFAVDGVEVAYDGGSL
jgi:hypothetical protein